MTSRYAAIAAMFTALGSLIDDYQAIPDHERPERWSRDAERLTGEVARQLGIARMRLAAIPPRPREQMTAEPPRGGHKPATSAPTTDARPAAMSRPVELSPAGEVLLAEAKGLLVRAERPATATQEAASDV